jgi:hypothetical protein
MRVAMSGIQGAFARCAFLWTGRRWLGGGGQGGCACTRQCLARACSGSHAGQGNTTASTATSPTGTGPCTPTASRPGARGGSSSSTSGGGGRSARASHQHPRCRGTGPRRPALLPAFPPAWTAHPRPRTCPRSPWWRQGWGRPCCAHCRGVCRFECCCMAALLPRCDRRQWQDSCAPGAVVLGRVRHLPKRLCILPILGPQLHASPEANEWRPTSPLHIHQHTRPPLRCAMCSPLVAVCVRMLWLGPGGHILLWAVPTPAPLPLPVGTTAAAGDSRSHGDGDHPGNRHAP